MALDQRAIIDYVTQSFEDVEPTEAWGDTFLFYNPDRASEPNIYFATLKSADDEGDRASNLDRPSVYRLNIGITRATYRSLFGSEAPGTGDEGGPDFTALDRLLPHPVYGRASWVSVLNPSETTFEELRPLLTEAYDLAVSKHIKQRDQEGSQTGGD